MTLIWLISKTLESNNTNQAYARFGKVVSANWAL